MLDGHLTLSGKRREEAAEEIDGSEDEVFQTDLYDWYLQENRTDKLLEVQSNSVVSYLERKSSEGIAHADLLWQYYLRSEDYPGAAQVQLVLAKSEYPLSLDRRIQYLGNAKTNASTMRPGVKRSARSEVLREVSDLLDVANIQSDLLQRLKGDSRITADRRPTVISELDGMILPLSVVSQHQRISDIRWAVTNVYSSSTPTAKRPTTSTSASSSTKRQTTASRPTSKQRGRTFLSDPTATPKRESRAQNHTKWWPKQSEVSAPSSASPKPCFQSPTSSPC